MLLDKMLTHLRSRKLLKPRGRQRTDSTHVLAAIRVMNRLELVTETSVLSKHEYRPVRRRAGSLQKPSAATATCCSKNWKHRRQK